MAEYKIIGIDLAKTKFHLAGIDKSNKVNMRKKISRDDFFQKFLPKISPHQTFAFEACGGCHYTAQEIEKRGHNVVVLKPKDVKAYAKSRQKNDINDAIAICKSSLDPDLMRVKPKTKKQQEIAYLHKARQNIIQQRIQRTNGLMTSLMEFGYIAKSTKTKFAKECKSHIKSALDENFIRQVIFDQMMVDCQEIEELLKREKAVDKIIIQENKESKEATLLQTIPGIGPINASILSIKPMEIYKEARDFSASLGLVPRQNTTGGIIRLGSITKQGDRYARTMLIQAARSIVMRTYKPNVPHEDLYLFAENLKLAGKPYNVICVAVANKLARIAHACITKGIAYGPAS
jgi:transposase